LKLANIIREDVGAEARFTLDGNEQYEDILAFREDWDALRAIAPLREFFDRCLLFVEQPVHRARALDESVQTQLENWPDAPPIIIDESDADLDSLPRALELGYAGTSHKNCKGIIKGLANLATIATHRQAGQACILSAEDLGNVGPVALLQDLAMVAALGIDHVERNGHHYFAGLSMFPSDEQDRMLQHHPDLYRRHERGYAALNPSSGQLQLGSVGAAPFGVGYLPDMRPFTSWTF
jgi:L-alanine-DL-glutamate epimerase-like enolase superfamily enzyme